ncbi:MAG: helix-turn-helix transcriptional regulator, partial [Ktedonobacterales bacterium]
MATPAMRLLTALDLLQARSSITAAELAERLNVNTRSARRYITTLQDIGIPIVAERGRYGGYRLRPGFKLPPLMLSDDEALAVTLGLLAARGLGLGDAVPAIEGALAK